MSKILFIMFQGAGTNLKSWNEYTESKFLDKLKTLGSVYTYQDKVNNIWHYDLMDPEHNDFNADIDFDLSYVRVNNHIKMVYNNIKNKYKNIDLYTFIPVGWSAGCLFALYFAQKYASKCLHVILLDPALWTPKNMKLRLGVIDKSGINDKPVSNEKFKKMLTNWKTSHTDKNNMYLINDVVHHVRSTYFSKHLRLKLSVPTTAFVNIQEPEKNEWSKDFNNKTRLDEIKILKKHNPDKYEAIIFTNKSHHIFNKIQPTKYIIKYIDSIISTIII